MPDRPSQTGAPHGPLSTRRPGSGYVTCGLTRVVLSSVCQQNLSHRWDTLLPLGSVRFPGQPQRTATSGTEDNDGTAFSAGLQAKSRQPHCRKGPVPSGGAPRESSLSLVASGGPWCFPVYVSTASASVFTSSFPELQMSLSCLS